MPRFWIAEKEKINCVVLLGGGALLLETAQTAQRLGFSIMVVTDPRHRAEIINGGLFWDQVGQLKPKGRYCISNLDADPCWRQTMDPSRTIGVSFGAVWIFKESIIDLFSGNLLNCHGANLPYDRGGGGASWRILRGDRQCRSIVHLVDEGIDTGPIVYGQSYEFPESCKVPEDYYQYQIRRDALFLEKFLKKLKKGFKFPIQEQDNSRSATWPRLHTGTHGAIDWRQDSRSICRFIRAFDDPYAGAFTFLSGEKVHLKGAEENSESFHPFQAGMVYRIWRGRTHIACESGSISVDKILGENPQIRLGDRFWTPVSVLETAMTTRMFYLSDGTRHPVVSIANPVLAR